MHDSLMVQGSYTQLASEVKMKGQRRFPTGKACSLSPNQWNLRPLENGKNFFLAFDICSIRRLFLGVGGKRGVPNLCISQFHLRPCPYSSRVAPGVGKCAAENDRRPCSLAPRNVTRKHEEHEVMFSWTELENNEPYRLVIEQFMTQVREFSH